MSPEPSIIIPLPQKSDIWCPYNSIFITGIISLIIVSFVLFLILDLLKILFHIKVSEKRLLFYSILIVMICSIIVHFFIGTQPFYLPFPFWLTPIDCLYQ